MMMLTVRKVLSCMQIALKEKEVEEKEACLGEGRY